jgi:hypothetical protein
MNNIQKRFLLFLFGCIPSRVALAYIAKEYRTVLPIMGYLALLPAIGFIYIWATGARKTGGEVFGEKIWWDDLRPVHATLYLLFAYNAIYKNACSWVYLFVDVAIGLTSFLVHHHTNNSFRELW